jgi:hypothetical protein
LHELNELCAQKGRSLDDFGLPMPVSHSNEVLHEIKQWKYQPDLLFEQQRQQVTQQSPISIWLNVLYLNMLQMPFYKSNLSYYSLLMALPVVVKALL